MKINSEQLQTGRHSWLMLSPRRWFVTYRNNLDTQRTSLAQQRISTVTRDVTAQTPAAYNINKCKKT